jgi:D-alanyl-D-alanine carboxypeptidase
MLRRGAFVRHGLRWGALGLTSLLLAGAMAGDADARARRHRHHSSHPHRASAAERYSPPTSSIVVDANSGAVLEASNPDALRHPASLTKMMTLYLLFERLESGKLKLSSELPVSAHAAAQAPSKMGLKPGDDIRVETAIKAIVTKSANDVAVVIGEALGGSEPNFAHMMTAKAHSLGMLHTTYRNASGLPDDAQVTTARDQSIIGRALRDRFPQYFHYFATRSFDFRGRVVRGHNRLLGNISGVDGIKTGYIRESGFNIVTSVHRGNRYIVAVVFGGRTARARDARVAGLIDETMSRAIAKRTAPPVVEGWNVAKPAEPVRTESIAHAAPVPARDPREQVASADGPLPGSTAPIKANPVKTIVVHPAPTHTATLAALAPADGKLAPPSTATVTEINTVKSEIPPVSTAPAREATLGTLSAKHARPVHTASAVAAPVPAPEAKTHSLPAPDAKPHSGWMIQVGAFDDEKEAKHRLAAAKEKAKGQLGKADPFTERVSKGKKSLYRARFAGLDEDAAKAACQHLKRSEIPCLMLRN